MRLQKKKKDLLFKKGNTESTQALKAIIIKSSRNISMQPSSCYRKKKYCAGESYYGEISGNPSIISGLCSRIIYTMVCV